MIADFVDIRGGGLLVLGAKSFVQQGFAGTPLESVLPLRLTDRGGGVVRVSARQDTRYAVTLTPEAQGALQKRLEANKLALDRAGRWRAEGTLERPLGDWSLAARVRGGLTGFQSLAEPSRSGPAQAGQVQVRAKSE